MKKILLLSFIILVLLSIHACISTHDYSQSYIILVNKKRVGTEIVNEKTDVKGNLVCLSEQEMDTPASKDKKRRKIRTRMVFQEGKLFPVSYSYESSTGTSYDVKVENGKIIRTLKGDGDSRESTTPFEPNMLMLDLTVFHTIDYWIRRYDTTRWRTQVFQTYLLPSATVDNLSINPVNTGILEQESKELQLKNYEIEMQNGMSILLWVDKDARLYRMFIRGPNIDVIRTDLFDKLSSKENDTGQE